MGFKLELPQNYPEVLIQEVWRGSLYFTMAAGAGEAGVGEGESQGLAPLFPNCVILRKSQKLSGLILRVCKVGMPTPVSCHCF